MQKALQDKLAEQAIELDIHAGQAPWQLHAAEGAIELLKDTATRIAKGRPDLPDKIVWSLAVLAFMEEERSHGFSPAQWALGRQPSFENTLLDEEWPAPATLSGEEVYFKKGAVKDEARKAYLDTKAKDRLRRGERARRRRQEVFMPGDAVFVWRKGRGLHGKLTDAGKPVRSMAGGMGGTMYGPARVLATETEELAGVKGPRKIVWIVYGGYLLRAAPEQLQRASPRDV